MTVKHLLLCVPAVVWSVVLVAGQGRGIGVPGKDVPQLTDEVLARVLPQAAGRDLVKEICGNQCHTVEPVVAHSGDRPYWEGIVYDMTLQGAQFTPEQQEQIVGYLAGQFPPRVNINLASAQVIEMQLKFSAAEAGAIVAYRTANGPFASIEAVRKVPGVLAETIDAASKRLTFGAR